MRPISKTGCLSTPLPPTVQSGERSLPGAGCLPGGGGRQMDGSWEPAAQRPPRQTKASQGSPDPDQRTSHRGVHSSACLLTMNLTAEAMKVGHFKGGRCMETSPGRKASTRVGLPTPSTVVWFSGSRAPVCSRFSGHTRLRCKTRI